MTQKNERLPVVTIRRSLTLAIPGLLASENCGAPLQNSYNISIRASVHHLDPSNFVCDNFRIPDVIREHFSSSRFQASCEQIAAELIHIIHSLCEGRALSIIAEVSPFAEAGIIVEWHSYQRLPDFRAIRLEESPLAMASTSQ